MHLLYLAALMLYLLGGLVFVIGCGGVALVSQRFRLGAFRAAASLLGTYPGVFLYQFLSLPLMMLLFIGGMILVSLPPLAESPETIIAWAALCFVIFGGVSVAGFSSGWRVVSHALRERPWWLALRRDSLVSLVLGLSQTSVARWMLSWRLFARSAESTSALNVVRWWELRRIPFNLLVGAVGVLTVGLLSWARIQSQVDGTNVLLLPEPPFLIAAILAYGVMANLCYTVGWLAEMALSRLTRSSTAEFASITCAFGFGFSILLTACPGLLGVVLWTVQRIPG